MAINIIRELLEKSDASGSKSTILKPLTWLLSVLIAGLLFLFKLNAPFWAYVFFSIIISVIIALFLFAYLYCLFKDRDSLRSEKFSIQKMAIEKGMYGDNLTGLHFTNDNRQITDKNASSSDQSETKE